MNSVALHSFKVAASHHLSKFLGSLPGLDGYFNDSQKKIAIASAAERSVINLYLSKQKRSKIRKGFKKNAAVLHLHELITINTFKSLVAVREKGCDVHTASPPSLVSVSRGGVGVDAVKELYHQY